MNYWNEVKQIRNNLRINLGIEIAERTKVIDSITEKLGFFFAANGIWHTVRRDEVCKILAELEKSGQQPEVAAALKSHYAGQTGEYVTAGKLTEDEIDQSASTLEQVIRQLAEEVSKYIKKQSSGSGGTGYGISLIAPDNATITPGFNPKDGNAHAELGVRYANMGQHNKAIDEFTQAIAVLNGKDKGAAYWCRGGEYSALGQYGKAIEDLTKAIELGPSDVTYHSRGCAYGMADRYKEALSDFETALRLNPNNSEVREKINRLKRMGY